MRYIFEKKSTTSNSPFNPESLFKRKGMVKINIEGYNDILIPLYGSEIVFLVDS